MIHNETFSKEWIQSIRQRIPDADPGIIEKLLRAYSLTEELVIGDLDFVFKGGTCLTLLTKRPRRFSTDVDVITRASRSEIEEVLTDICKRSSFTHFALDEDRSYKEGIPKAHYFLFFNSALDGGEKSILLDLLFADPSYPKIIDTPISGELLKLDGSATLVQTPTMEGLLGDKLTAFAPTTTGILFGSRKELEIVKQLYDLGVMFGEAVNFNDIEAAFNSHVEKELSYRSTLNSDRKGVLRDTFAACLMITRREPQPSALEKTQFAEVQQGLRSFRGFTINDPFRIEQAMNASAKVAVLVAKLMKEDRTPIPIMDTSTNRLDYLIPAEATDYAFMNRKLRSIEPSAQFYWYSALKILNKI